VPIIEIALNCGFKDGAHFSRAYRKMFGHPPRVSRNAAVITVA
jgi:transcriptional regulator GlxA family with amidase domain